VDIRRYYLQICIIREKKKKNKKEGKLPVGLKPLTRRKGFLTTTSGLCVYVNLTPRKITYHKYHHPSPRKHPPYTYPRYTLSIHPTLPALNCPPSKHPGIKRGTVAQTHGKVKSVSCSNLGNRVSKFHGRGRRMRDT
jgi:hypothetical protein